MKSRTLRSHRQGGFTLVEMSVVLVIAGLLFAAVTTGQELVNTAKAKKMVNDVLALDKQLQLYSQGKGRFPGDCNADGVIDYAADLTTRRDDKNDDRSALYAFSSDLPTIPAGAGDEATLQTDGCALTGTPRAPADAVAASGSDPAIPAVTAAASTVVTSATNANVWLNDLKLAGMVSDSAANRKLAKMVTEDFLFVGNIIDGTTASESANGAAYNAIVMHNVPQWMAIRMAQAINGQDAQANRSRLRNLVRNSGIDGTYEASWQAMSEDDAGAGPAMRDAMVTVAYFFDQVPESKQ